MRTINKRGISLIVLVITMIVMIILASAVILSLNSSEIIKKANTAKTSSDEANLKEYVGILEAEYELMPKAEKKDKTIIQYVNEKLEDNGYKQALLMEDGTLYTNLQDNAKKALKAGIKIGDEVTGYILDTSKDPIPTNGKENTEPDGGHNLEEERDTPQSVSQTAYSKWRYIGIGANGEIIIAPEMPDDEDVTINKMKLSGRGGCLNGPDRLDLVCKALYSTDKGNARSINIEDINRILEYTPPKSEKLSDLGIITGTTPTGDIGDYYANSYSISINNTSILKSLKDDDRKELLLNFVYTNNDYWLASMCVAARTQLEFG